jgi:beta-barrel assembly-enhancing protease
MENKTMTRTLILLCVTAVAIRYASPCEAQLGDVLNKAGQVAKRGKKAVDIYTPWTAEEEEQAGSASAAKLVSIFGLYDNPEMVRYVNLVGSAVAQQAPRPVPYKFGILDTEAITALSLPGGYVFVTRGALANMHSEAELAGTLAHEVAHVDQRHLEKEIRSKQSMQFVKDQASQFNQTGLGVLAANSVQSALTQQYSRDKEADADRLGVEFAEKAGYAPNGLRLFLTFLSQAPKTPETTRQLSLWGSTHPSFPQRIASLTAVETKYPGGGQSLQTRFGWYVNPVAFARIAPNEMDGVVQNGSVALTGLANGTRVKVRVPQ